MVSVRQAVLIFVGFTDIIKNAEAGEVSHGKIRFKDTITSVRDKRTPKMLAGNP